jgi:tetratricopeptide (TPR) repeat protein
VGEARELTDRSYRLILEGRLREALPLAESALAGLDGTGDEYEGNALNNMGVILTGLGRCDEAEGFLERAQGTGSQSQNRERVANLERARECAPRGAPASADAAESLPSVAQARADTERSYVLIQNGREEEGLALQLPALRALEPTGDPYAGNAAYNIGLAYVQLGRCGAAVPYLEQSQGSGNASQNAIRRDMLARARACD